MATIFYYLAIFIVTMVFYGFFSRFEKSYKNHGKGSFKQKTLFSIQLIALFFIPFLICQYFGLIEFWFDSVRFMLAFMIFIELYSSWKDKGDKAFALVLILLTFFAFIVFPSIGVENDQKVYYFLVLGAIVIMQDTFMSIFGKCVVKRLPDGTYKMRYPKIISPNKTVMSVLLGVIANIVLFSGLLNYEMSFVFTASIATAIGDAIFSIYKRVANLDDFSHLLGPIGGFSDRFDGWVFAIILVEILTAIEWII
jgi:CDP-diglyceride synthetase